jgi:integrase
MGKGADRAGDSAKAADGREKRLIDRFREAMRARHYSLRTEKAYWYWIRWFIRFHGTRHPAQMGAAEVTAFLSWLATRRDVAAATQNQALSAILFLYKHVLGEDLPWLSGLVRAQRPVRVPVVLTRARRCGGCSSRSRERRGSCWGCSTERGCGRSSACRCG